MNRTRMLLLGVVCAAMQTSASANSEAIENLLGTAVTCRLAQELLLDMPVEPLYRQLDGACVAQTPDNGNVTWFDDSSCANPVQFNPLPMQSYCLQAADRATLGNGTNITENTWTLTPGNRLDLGARSLDGVSQPYMQRVVYKSISTARGTCDLEMRIYKKHPSSSGQKSLLALHGGSWSSRSFGYLGLELTVPHLVDRGFVVYAPFYRLLDNSDSSTACHNAQFDDITSDAGSALDWVLDNAGAHGSAGLPVVFGQSAGGHLALSLSVNRPASIGGALLFYPPTDFTDFLLRVKNGRYTNAKGLSILERVVGEPAAQAESSLPVVIDNSFPARIANEGGDWPPMFIVQGGADTLVEHRQSVRLCDALAGRELTPADVEELGVTELRESMACGSTRGMNSSLQLVKLGDHALDVCIDENLPDLCPSGDAASRSLVSQSIGEALDFAVTAANNNAPAGNGAPGGGGTPAPGRSGGGAFGAGMGAGLVFLLVLQRTRGFRQRRKPRVFIAP